MPLFIGVRRLRATPFVCNHRVCCFTGKLRDNESGLDFFGARYFSGSQGRFTSVDPVLLSEQRMFDPQQWNLYGYARNNPLRFMDEDGDEVIESRQVVPYEVSGSTLAEARANADSHFQGQYAGNTTPTVRVDYNLSRQASTNADQSTTIKDTVTSDTIHLDQTIELPVWTGGTEEEQKAFSSDVSTLQSHEEGHADINRSAADALDKSLPGTTAAATRKAPQAAAKAADKKLGDAVDAKTKSAASERDRKNEAYDAQTNHGKPQCSAGQSCK